MLCFCGWQHCFVVRFVLVSIDTSVRETANACSPDNHYLLAELFVGQWGSDWGEFGPVLYDAWDGVFSPENFPSKALSTYVGHGCYYGARSLGFAPDGGVVLKSPARLQRGRDHGPGFVC